MKVKKSLVEQIIKEETEKIKTLLTLQEERVKIIKQLNELYEEDVDLDEANWLGMPSKEERQQEFNAAISTISDENTKNFFSQLSTQNVGDALKYIKIFQSKIANNPNKLKFFVQVAAEQNYPKTLGLIKLYASTGAAVTPSWDEKSKKWNTNVVTVSNVPGAGATAQYREEE